MKNKKTFSVIAVSLVLAILAAGAIRFSAEETSAFFEKSEEKSIHMAAPEKNSLSFIVHSSEKKTALPLAPTDEEKPTAIEAS